MRSSTLLALLFAAVGPTACGSCDDKSSGGGGATDSGSASAAMTPDAGIATIGKRPFPRNAAGPVGMLAQAARSLDLKEEQKTKLDAAEKSLRGDEASTRDEMRALHADLAAGVKAGKLDQAKIDGHLAAIEKAAKDRYEKETTALNDVYAALEPAQRTAVVAKIRSKNEQRDKRIGERMAERGAKTDGGGPDGGGTSGDALVTQKRIERLSQELDLDAEQQKKALAALKEDPKTTAATMETMRNDAKKRGEALLAAFEKDGFDAKKLEVPDTKRARTSAEQEVKLVNVLLPILKPEQRDKLAARMEKQSQGSPAAPHGGMGARGAHRRGFGAKPQGLGPDYDWFDDDEDESAGPTAGSASAPTSPASASAPAP